ncbi:CRE-TAG-180 protein [Caenorhabditis remanei]|uniref:CRE-TAG-180 protein n=1 Tax=Caenorhabditis remanei TaxID=31234 RepID=E3LFB3_CAERE|nr:CRE-TAG-180 protein [Caenorhabditis remanei]
MLFILTILFRLSLSHLPNDTIEEAPPSIAKFSSNILRDFETQSRFSIVQTEFEKLKPDIKSKKEDAAEKLREATEHLDRLVSSRVQALKKLASSAEASAAVFDEYDDQAYAVPQSDKRCEAYMKKMNESDMHFVSNMVEQNSKSGIHITVESYQCDPRVMRDFDWTGTKFIEKTMTENKEKDPDMGQQYIGTYSGLTRMYPRRHWKVEPAPITIDLFDPRFRPWYVNAESVPKDIVFLLDYSGSVKGPTMHLIKITMMYILSTLSPNDYFFGVYFNNHFNPIISCANRTFMPATTSNKKVFFEELGMLEEKDQAHFSTPLKFSLDVLRGNLDSNQSLFADYRSEGHKLLIIFTDGVDEWPHQILDEEFQTRNSELIRIFGFSMGYGTSLLPLQQYMACKSHGGYSEIDSIMDVKPQSRTIQNVLSEVRGDELKGTKAEKREPSWTQLYMETQGSGPTVTLSLPILTSDQRIWRDQSLAGVVGESIFLIIYQNRLFLAIDISIKELTKHLPTSSEQMYGYIVDNNGMLIYHPQLQIPKTEVHCVRRSACYDAQQVKQKAGSGLRVHYGFSDERVYRLVGLIDSIPTLDMYDLEGDSTAIRDLRRRITTKTCYEEAIKDDTKEFHCAHIKDSPFTVVIVNNQELKTVYYDDEVPDLELSNNKLVTFFYPRRDVCQWKLDEYQPYDRFRVWSDISDKEICAQDDMRLARAFTKALGSWTQSWPQSDIEHTTCLLVQFPDNASIPHYVNSFVHTRSKLTAFYPTCSSHDMKAVNKKFDEEIKVTDNNDFIQFSMRSGSLLIYRTIADYENNRLAVVGTQWKENYFDQYFDNFTRQHSDWKVCRKQECSIITRNGHVIASSANRQPAHLATFDPQLFESLIKINLVSTNSWVDVQSECKAKRIAPWSSAAPASSSILRYFVNSLFKFAQTSFWKNLLESAFTLVDAQPSMSGKTCTFQKIKPFERCFMKFFHYRMTLNITKQLQLTGMSTCSRYAKLYPVPNTTLSLIIADRACSQYRPKRTYEAEPKKMEKCEVVHSHARRRPNSLNDWKIELQNKHVDCINESLPHHSIFFTILLVIISSFRIF